MQENNSTDSAGPSTPVSAVRQGGALPEDAEMDPMALLAKYVLPYWKWYLVAGFACAVLFAALSYLVKPIYKATVVAQVEMGSSVDSRILKARLGGLSSVMGLSQLGNGDSKFLFNMNYVGSREPQDAFMEKYDFRRQLFYDLYDEEGNYEKPEKLAKMYRKILGDDYAKNADEDILLTPGPSKRALFKAFDKVFKIDVDTKEMIMTVTVEWENPLKTKQWANDYVAFVNDLLRTKAIEESNLKIEYLLGQIKERPEIEVQNSIYSLVEEELKKIAVAESSDQYAFKIIERAFLPERRISPNRYKFLFLGGFFGCFLVLAKVAGPDVLKKVRSGLESSLK